MSPIRSHMLALLVSLSLAACLPVPPPQPAVADFGDAPDGEFPTLLASDGARTLDPSPFWLGSQGAPGATLEDDAQVVNLDQQEDGMVGLLVADKVRVTFQVAKSEQAAAGVVYFNLLADTNGDGRWQGYSLPTPSGAAVSEWIVQNQALNLGPGETARIEARFPEVRGNLEVWIRATVTDSSVPGGDWDGTGQFRQGEVEDHLIRPDLAWDVKCTPMPREISHGGSGWIDLIVSGLLVPPAPAPTFDLQITSVTGTLGPLGDPLALQVNEWPLRNAGWQANVPFAFVANPRPVWMVDGVFVQSIREAIHSLPDTDIYIGYFITFELKATQGEWTGIKTGECRLTVAHPAVPPPSPMAIQPALILTDDGYRVAYTGPIEARTGETLQATFEVHTPEGKPARGTLNASLGDPPSDPKASHASGELDADGKVTLLLEVNWRAGTTALYISHGGKVYKVTDITIRP